MSYRPEAVHPDRASSTASTEVTTFENVELLDDY